MDRIYKYNPNVSYNPNGGRYLQLITANDLYRDGNEILSNFKISIVLHIV